MISVVVSGNLVEPPKKVFENKSGNMFGIRFGSNTYKRDNNSKETVKDTVWCSGLINEKKIAGILPFLKKGTYVVVSAPDATIKTFTKSNGETSVSLDLRFIHTVEAGNLDRGGQQQQQGAYAASTPQYQQQGQYQQQQPQPQYQQPPQQQYNNDSLPF